MYKAQSQGDMLPFHSVQHSGVGIVPIFSLASGIGNNPSLEKSAFDNFS